MILLVMSFVFPVLACADTVQLIQQMKQSQSQIQNFHISVQAESTSLDDKAKKKSETWDLFCSPPYSFHADYSENGTQRQIMSDGKIVWEYIPKEKALLETRISHLNESKRLFKVAKAMESVQLPLLFSGALMTGMKKRKVESETVAEAVVFGKFYFDGKPVFGRFRINKKMAVVEHVEILRNNIPILSITFSGYHDFKGVMVPSECLYRIREQRRNVDFFAKILVWEHNIPLPPERFVFQKQDDEIQVFSKKAK